MENQSEVARLLQRIEAEYEATKRGLEGYAITARHEFITTRMERMAAHHVALINLVGESEAARILIENDQKLAQREEEREHGDD
jgi:hypothetical protein